MDISVLLPTFRRPESLQRTLRSFSCLITESLSWEVLVVDNADDVQTAEVVHQFTKKIPVRCLVETRRGKNNALNRALPEAKGEIVLFTDDDVVVAPDWLIEIWAGAQRWPGYSVFGGRCLPKYPEGKQMPFEHEFLVGAFTIADWNIQEGCYEADKVWGTNMAIRAAVFRDGWRFDPTLGPDGTDYCLLGDETDLTTRLERQGYKAVYLPRALVYHQIPRERMTLEWLYKRSFSFGREDAFIEMKKNLPMVTVFGVPTYLAKRMGKEIIKYCCALLTIDKRDKFARKLGFWHTKGMIYQYRRQSLRNPGASVHRRT